MRRKVCMRKVGMMLGWGEERRGRRRYSLVLSLYYQPTEDNFPQEGLFLGLSCDEIYLRSHYLYDLHVYNEAFLCSGSLMWNVSCFVIQFGMILIVAKELIFLFIWKHYRYWWISQRKPTHLWRVMRGQCNICSIWVNDGDHCFCEDVNYSRLWLFYCSATL